jgi:hypothetical protein
MDSRSPKQLAIDLRRRAKGFPYSSEDRKLLIASAKEIEQLEESRREAILALLEEKGVPLTPEQKAKLGIDSTYTLKALKILEAEGVKLTAEDTEELLRHRGED